MKKKKVGEYLPPSPHGVQNHVCVLPCGGLAADVPRYWTTADLQYYTSYMLNGKPVDRMFNGFVFNGISVRDDHFLYPMYAGFAQPATQVDWTAWIETLFAPGKNLHALASLVTSVPFDVWISIPYPYLNQKNFGQVEDKILDFAQEGDRFLAVSWWIEQFLNRWQQSLQLVSKLNFRGFMWQRESVHNYDEKLVQSTNKYVRSKGVLSMWLPFYGSYGSLKLPELGFDIVAFHPNFLGNTEFDYNWIKQAAIFARQNQTGIQIVYGKGPFYNNTHLLDYLNLGLPAYENYQQRSFLAYRFPHQTMKEIHANQFLHYIYLYTFIKGCYPKIPYPNIPYK